MENSTKKEKLRLSYTLLKLWQQNRVDDAIIYYFKLGKITNKYMEEGLKWDKLVNDSVEGHRKLPTAFGGGMLSNPKSQLKLVAQYNTYYDLVGVIDILDETILYEIKTGSSKDSADYSLDFQIGIYLLLTDLSKIEVEKAIILHYDQNRNTLDKTLIWNSIEERKRAKNYIDTLAPDIYEYFKANKLFGKEVYYEQ